MKKRTKIMAVLTTAFMLAALGGVAIAKTGGLVQARDGGRGHRSRHGQRAGGRPDVRRQRHRAPRPKVRGRR